MLIYFIFYIILCISLCIIDKLEFDKRKKKYIIISPNNVFGIGKKTL